MAKVIYRIRKVRYAVAYWTWRASMAVPSFRRWEVIAWNRRMDAIHAVNGTRDEANQAW